MLNTNLEGEKKFSKLTGNMEKRKFQMDERKIAYK
jgi:hypothetical protein